MSLWVDAYRPRSLSTLTYHTDQAACLSSLVKREDFPHLLVYGPTGAGKKTRIHCILSELYGSGAEHKRMETKSFTAPSGKKLDILTTSSNYHIELNPGDVGIYDRVVVQDIIKQMAQTSQIDVQAQKTFKVVVLHEVDSLTREAQHALRRTMEKYSGTCRLMLCCESLSRVIDPLRSRCMAIRVAAPSDQDMRSAISVVCQKEKFSIPEAVVARLIEKSQGNMRRALLMLQSMDPKKNSITSNYQMPEPEWEVYLRETARMILAKQNQEQVRLVRDRLYELLSRCIPADVIFVQLTRHLLPSCDSAIRTRIMEAASEYEHRLTRGSKAILHLEAFVLAFMDMYSKSTKAAKN